MLRLECSVANTGLLHPQKETPLSGWERTTWHLVSRDVASVFMSRLFMEVLGRERSFVLEFSKRFFSNMGTTER